MCRRRSCLFLLRRVCCLVLLHGFQDRRLSFGGTFQPFKTGNRLIQTVPGRKETGPFRPEGGLYRLCQLAGGLRLLYGLLTHQGPAYVFQVPPGFVVLGAYGLYSGNGLLVRLYAFVDVVPQGCQPRLDMEEPGGVIQRGNSAFLHSGQRIFTALNDTGFQLRETVTQGKNTVLQDND